MPLKECAGFARAFVFNQLSWVGSLPRALPHRAAASLAMPLKECAGFARAFVFNQLSWVGSLPRALPHRRRDVLDLAGDDVGADLPDLCDFGLRHLRADLADGDAVVLEAEDDVPTFELPVCDELDRIEHRRVHPLHRAGQDVRPEKRLVGVDADAPDVLLLGRVQRAQTAATRHLEDHARALLDLVQRDLLALRLVVPVLRVGIQRRDAGIRGPRSRLVAGDEAIDRRLLLATDRADDVLPRTPLLLEAGEVTDQIAGLLLFEEEAEEIRGLVLFLGLADVDNRELRARKVRRHRVDRIRLGEADSNC